jgi:predicted phosphodiesterase
MRKRFPDADAVVFGHSHLPLHEVGGGELSGFEIFNPGSPTERRRAPQPSMGLLESDHRGLRFEHVWL